MSEKSRVHWLGAGLSSVPGIVALANERGNVTLWNRTLEKADAVREHVSNEAGLETARFDMNDLAARVQPGDVVVSMLPAAMHAEVARLALDCDANMVTTSYLSEDMRSLDSQAIAKGVTIMNECGVDPGIDHLFAHVLVDEARKAGVLGPDRTVDFVSHCGGVPAVPNDFRYKFSWTPLGVLTALKNEARSIKDGEVHVTNKAWTEVETIKVLGEEFEVYANRDSVAYIPEYGLDTVGNLRTFVRGTLRLGGWTKAWSDIFATVETADMDTLRALSERLWNDYQYDEGEKDRVLLYVALSSEGPDGDKWHASLSLDERGSGWQTAMARTVSLAGATAIEAILDGRVPAGVHMGTSDPAEARRWLSRLSEHGIGFRAENITL